MPNPSFFAHAGPFQPADIAAQTGAVLKNQSGKAIDIHTAAPIEAAVEGAISFLDNASYLEHLATTSASAVFCKEQHAKHAPESLCILVHPNPYQAYAQTLNMLYPTSARPQPVTGETAISAGAYLAEDVQCEDDVVIEPGCVIGKSVSIGAGSQILAGAVIGAKVQIGRGCTIGPNATITHTFMGDEIIIHPGASIGQDGFGFAMGPSGHRKVPQVGRVIIQDKVEIGANSAIDRGANRDTIIGEGCKIDNLVQIGHNVVLGRHCVIVGLVGISGSVTLGDFVVVAGQAGIIGHVTIGSGAQIGGGSRVHRNIEPGEKIMGYPSIPADLWMRKAAKAVREAKKWRRKGKREENE
jgi:UDP-3-O-[3-hydroxymyristoyl] glucosamine N-acyltransferase